MFRATTLSTSLMWKYLRTFALKTGSRIPSEADKGKTSASGIFAGAEWPSVSFEL
jgi:hypothetical protein